MGLIDDLLRQINGALSPRLRRRLREFNSIMEHNGHDYDTYRVFQRRIPVARKGHCCDFCDEDIQKGTRYVTWRTRGQEGPGWEDWKAHGECYLGVDWYAHNKSRRPSWCWAEGDERPRRDGGGS